MAKMAGFMSQRLRDDLQRGEVKGFELIRTAPAQVDYDEYGYTQEIASSMKLCVKQSLGDQVVNVLRAVTARAKRDNFDGVRIRFKRDEGKERTIHVAAGREDVEDVLYSRYELVTGFSAPMKQATEALRSDMVKKMRSVLIAQNSQEDITACVPEPFHALSATQSA